MDAFIYNLERGAEETEHDFNTRFDRETSKAEKMAGALVPMWNPTSIGQCSSSGMTRKA